MQSMFQVHQALAATLLILSFKSLRPCYSLLGSQLPYIMHTPFHAVPIPFFLFLLIIPRPFPTRVMPLTLRFSINMSFSWLPIFYHSILHQIPGPSLRSRSCSQKFWHSAPFQWRP